LLSRLLIKDPAQRLTNAEEIMHHGFFGGIDWDRMVKRDVDTPYKPVLQDPTDTSHFDKEQTDIPVFSPPSKNHDLK